MLLLDILFESNYVISISDIKKNLFYITLNKNKKLNIIWRRKKL